MQRNQNNNAQQFKFDQQRRQLPKSTWINRNPRLFVTVTTTAALCVFFSRPIYDFFIRDDLPDINELRKNHKSRFNS